MMKLLVIADDLTGAMDTGVQFSDKGIRTLVTMDPEICMAGIDPGVLVLVVNTESRHLSGAAAYRRVHHAAQSAKQSGIACIMKKTDSTLRGNIGSELQAVLDAWDTPDIMFLPAYPANGRTTVNGRQYVHGVPLELTSLAADPLEPITSSDIRHIIGRQCGYRVVSATSDGFWPPDEFRSSDEFRPPDEFRSSDQFRPPDELRTTHELGSTERPACRTAGPYGKTIRIFDSRTQEELLHAVQWLNNRHSLHVTAGCAGLAAALADTLDFGTLPERSETDGRRKDSESDDRSEFPESDSRSSCPELPSGGMLTVCGSLNAVSLAQIAYAADHGFVVAKMTPEEKLAAVCGAEWRLDDKANEISSLMDAGKDVIIAAALGVEDILPCGSLADGTFISTQGFSTIITGNIAQIVRAVLRKKERLLLVIFGGDTAIGIMNKLEVQMLEPCREIQPGIVLSMLETGSSTYWLVTKAGGFGETDILLKIKESICPIPKLDETISKTPVPQECSTEE